MAKKKIIIQSNLLSPKNIDMNNQVFLRDYNAATSTFNDFFGPMTMLAHNAMLEAYDAYEDNAKPHIIRAIKRTLRQYDRFWAAVKFLFESKYTLYVDFCIKMTQSVDADVQKLYLAFSQCLANDGVKDNRRMAWAYVADLLNHNTLHSYRQFLDGVTRQTGNSRVSATFHWANPSLLTDCSERLIRTLHGNMPITDNISLALEIIAKRINNARVQDDAAMAVVEYKEHESYKEEWKDGIEEYKAKREQIDNAEREANEAYYRKVEEQKAKRNRATEETLTADHMAEILSNQFKVSRL